MLGPTKALAAKSSLPSPFSAAMQSEGVEDPPAKYITGGRNETDALATAIEKNWGLETPPPGLGLTTVTEAVDAVAMSDAGTVAVSWVTLINVVANGEPFQFTVEAATNPAPFTVRVNPTPPGAVASGTSG